MVFIKVKKDLPESCSFDLISKAKFISRTIKWESIFKKWLRTLKMTYFCQLANIDKVSTFPLISIQRSIRFWGLFLSTCTFVNLFNKIVGQFQINPSKLMLTRTLEKFVTIRCQLRKELWSSHFTAEWCDPRERELQQIIGIVARAQFACRDGGTYQKLWRQKQLH